MFRDVDVLAYPEGEAANQGPRLRSSEVAPKWSVVAVVEHLRTQAAADGYAEAVCLALPARPRRYKRPQRTRNVPPFGVLAGMPTGDP